MNDTSVMIRPIKSIIIFGGLVFAISLPFYILMAFIPQNIAMFIGIILAFAPLIAVLVLVCRENRMDGIRKLLKRALDLKITRKVWYIPILFLMPVIFLLSLGILVLMGEKIPATMTPVVIAPLALLMFFIFALFEEVAWMGYAFDTLQDRWNALIGSLVLGIIWGTWHLPLYFLAGLDPVWIGGQFVGLIFFRILIVWIYSNTGRSIFAAILFHAVYNVCTMTIPGFSTKTGHIAINLTIIITAIMIGVLWDTRTMSQYKYAKKEQRISI